MTNKEGKKMKKSKSIAIVVVILAFLGLLGWYAADVLSNTEIKKGNGSDAETTEAVESTEVAESNSEEKTKDGIKLGLDLNGGVSITYQIVDENPSQTDINDTIAKLEQRAENYTTEYSVYQVGDDRITVEIPGVYDANAVLEELGSPGSLYFIPETDSSGNKNYTYNGTAGKYDLSYELDSANMDQLVEEGKVLFDGSHVKHAEAVLRQNEQKTSKEWEVELNFDATATESFGTATTKAYANSESIGIYYDGEFISVPNVQSAITDGNCVINGMAGQEEAEKLATFIRVGAINLELEELESNVVGAQLGSQALGSSFKAAAIGLILVMIFMIVMYGISGVAASVALAIYTVLVVAMLTWFEITLTLPGIAGIILGIGMAVDANVITFARIREEIANGKTVIAAINEGYKKALSAILDGNITTFIAALVLMILGSGTVRGFAYTLMISILVSMFSALFVAKYLMRAFYALGLKDEKFYGRAKERKTINFMKHKVIYFAISLIVIVAGIVGMIVNSASGRKSLNYSLEFVGGTSMTFDFDGTYTKDTIGIEAIEEDIVPEIQKIIGNGAIQTTVIQDSTKAVFKTKLLDDETREKVESTLEEKYGAEETDRQNIGSTISGEMRRNAIGAVIVACIFMLLYIWFRFKDIRFATGAILALAHDVLVVLTAYALIRISVGNTFIACMLTIVGYSVNDTIVIFDRIRENMHGVHRVTPEALAEVANKSLTQTLSRSINTSITTFIMVLLLFVLGVSSIQEFALPLMVGLVCGSYSSIFIATELWYVLKLHVGKNRLVKKEK